MDVYEILNEAYEKSEKFLFINLDKQGISLEALIEEKGRNLAFNPVFWVTKSHDIQQRDVFNEIDKILETTTSVIPFFYMELLLIDFPEFQEWVKDKVLFHYMRLVPVFTITNLDKFTACLEKKENREVAVIALRLVKELDADLIKILDQLKKSEILHDLIIFVDEELIEKSDPSTFRAIPFPIHLVPKEEG
ncbi:MAG: hypothetical protein ACTSRW_10795 [Candidatus Helarchaeota archaeon]